MSTDPTWRVYLPEWLIVYTSDATGSKGADECRAVYARKYGGRVRPEDAAVSSDILRSADVCGPVPYTLKLRLPNLKGEFKDHGDALDLASGLMDRREGDTCVVVPRGSAEERALLDYGKKMLPRAG